MKILLVFLIVFLVGCESEIKKQSSKSFDKILIDKKRVKQLSKEDPSVNELMTREINSQTDRSKEKKNFLFK